MYFIRINSINEIQKNLVNQIQIRVLIFKNQKKAKL